MTGRKILAVILFSCIFKGVYAQDPVDIFNISQTSFSYSTARSAAMGGAFTALGADGASAFINPAGIGMYKASDFSITGSLLLNKVESTTTGPLGTYATDDKKSSGPLNNITAIANVYNSDAGILKAVNFGFVYNRSNDLTSKQYVSGNYTQTSLLDMFATQLNDYNIAPGSILSNNPDDPYAPYRSNPVSLWGGMLAYNTGLLYVTDNSPYMYSLSSGGNTGTLFNGDEVYPELMVNTSSYTADYGFTFGFNLMDKIYIGTTLSALNYQYSSVRRYSEYANIDPTTGNYGDLDIFDYTQTYNTIGSGFSFKFGITAEVTENLKIGAAVHAPSIYNIRDEYYADMDSYYRTEPEYLYAGTPYFKGEYRVITPTKMLLGASYTIGERAILSIDYDRTLYNKMKVTDGLGTDGENSLNSEIKENYQATNNFRIGAEFRLTNIFYVRGGYAYYGNPLKNESNSQNVWQNISGGFGVKLLSFYADITYVNMQNDTSSQYFYNENISGGIKSDQTYRNKFTNNSIMATLGFRF